MIGGFYRTTNGVRDAGFPADDGGQLSASLTRKLDQGELTVYARSHQRQERLLHRRAADLGQRRPHDLAPSPASIR